MWEVTNKILSKVKEQFLAKAEPLHFAGKWKMGFLMGKGTSSIVLGIRYTWIGWMGLTRDCYRQKNKYRQLESLAQWLFNDINNETFLFIYNIYLLTPHDLRRNAAQSDWATWRRWRTEIEGRKTYPREKSAGSLPSTYGQSIRCLGCDY